jgi:hypothetical protein
MKETDEFKKLKEALQVLDQLNVPEHLQSTALDYLLNHGALAANGNSAPVAHSRGADASMHTSTPTSLRGFVEEMKPKGAVAEIPCLLYWAKTHEDRHAFDEKGVIELYRMAGLKPPRNVAQSLRDLASKRYGRVEAVSDQKGHVRLSRVGEDFVLHDVKSK